jgi:hypothetical protein
LAAIFWRSDLLAVDDDIHPCHNIYLTPFSTNSVGLN